MNSRTATQNSGKLLGGSSAINGGYYVAPSRAGIDAWASLGNQGWEYDGIHQACRQSIQIHPPSPTICQAVGLEQAKDCHASGGEGPVQVSAELQEHPITDGYFRTLKDLGYVTTTAIFNGHSACGQPLYFTQVPSSKKRSAADTAFGSVLSQRANVKVTTEATVTKVILDGEPPRVRAKGVEVLTGTSTTTVLASKEVILCAGAFHTPKILELSGIGEASLLQKHRIPVFIENAHVGERLRNHVMSAVRCELSQELPPTSGMLGMAYMSSRDQPGLMEVLQTYTPQGNDKKYDEVVRNIFTDPREGSGYHFVGFMGKPNAVTFGVISAIPFSSGSTHVSSSKFHEKPTIDPSFFSNTLDLEVLARHLQTAANFPSQPALRPYFKIDSNGKCPGAAAVEDIEKAKQYVRENSRTTYHSCGTASMRPKADGGVVDEQLLVYDTENLRVVDASVIPLIPHGNPMAVVYGLAERAADIIKIAISA